MSENEEWLNSLPMKIMDWYSDFQRGVAEAVEYIQTVKEIRRLAESLGRLSLNGYQEKDELLQRVHNIPQLAISRLEELFSHILIKKRKALEPERLPFQSSDDDMSFVNLIASVDDEPSKCTQAGPQRDNTRSLKENVTNLVHPNRITVLKCIAEVMFASGQDAQCCQASISLRKEALHKCLLVLEVEDLGTKDELQMDWSSSNSKIKKWFRVVKIFIRVYLASEKSLLADKVFGVSGSIGQTCFIEASKSLILQLLSFGEAVAMRNHSPEKFFPILYMYDGFVGLLPYIDVLFSAEAGSFVSTRAHEVANRLGEFVKKFLNEFGNAVRTNELSTPFTEGGVHHLTVHVMNHLKALADCSDTLNILLEGGGEGHSSSSSSNVNTEMKDDIGWSSASSGSPMSRCLQSIISVLELNLESKSQLYTDVSLQHVFLMNNNSYVALKVKDSELQTLLGKNWIRKHEEKLQRHTVKYEIASWGPVHYLLSSEEDCPVHLLLSSEAICNAKSGSVSKAIIKERIQGFNLTFEEIYRTQTAWFIHNDQLREDLRTSISLKVLQAYRTFLGNLAGERHSDRYIKYSVEDLKEFLLDLFEGSPKSLHNSRRLKAVFSRILIENRLPLELERLSFQSSNDDMSFVNFHASECPHVRFRRDSTRGLKEYIIDLVHPNAIPDLKRIAEVLFASGYDAECCQAYISVRQNAVKECLLVLEIEKLDVTDVLQLDWSSLDFKIKKWVQAMNIFVCAYLASEKSLAHEIFGVPGSVGQTCFIEASKDLILQLLSFGNAVAIINHSPDNIFPILYMYDGFLGLLPNIHVLFLHETGSYVIAEAREVLNRLGESVRRSLNEFKNFVRTKDSSSPFARGEVHHLTMHVMSYLVALSDYSDALNILLKGGGDDHTPSSSNVNMAIEDDGEWRSSSISPIAQCLQSMISILESNLESKSKLYADVSLQHFFLMNNICYMAQKVKDSQLRPLLGENWIKKHDRKFQRHAVNYESDSWSPVLSFLRDEGLCDPKSGLVYKAILKVRFLLFNLAFEEIYRTQTVWLIRCDKLREDLRISISLKVLQAYQTFLERHSYQLAGEKHSDRYIKYGVKDLQEFLLDLFAGSPRSLNESHSLDEEFRHILIENRLPLEPEHLPFQSSNDDMSSVDLIASVHDEPSEGAKARPQRDNMRGLEEYIIDLVHSNVIPDLKRIAEVMFTLGYDAECCQAYITIRQYALEECLLVLEVEKLSIKDVLQMDWSSLNSKIKKWVRAMKIFVRVYLASEKSLAHKVFEVSGSVGQTCFIEASTSLLLQLLSFSEAVAMRNQSPEKICPILSMCDGLMDLLPDIDGLYSDNVGSCVSTEAREVLTGLGESVMRTLNQFKNAVKTNDLYTPFARGGVHHLTKYVMKYLKVLTDYSDTLNFLLEVGGEDHLPSSSYANTAIDDDDDDDDDEWNSSPSDSPVARCLQSMISILESNLESKSYLYKDVSLQHFFLMNNICYMVHKVKDSKLQPLLGKNWMRKQDRKFLQHAADYVITSWTPVLSFLRHQGTWNPRSGSVSKAILKERFQGFNLAFEEIYRTQKTWLIHNDQLRDDLRISISLKVVLAYRSFLEKYSYQLAGRYIKYSAEDLHEFLLDMFEGSPKPLHKSHRR